MGQYYKPVTGDKEGKKITVYDRSVNGKYTMAKLMEHSWWLNECCGHVVKILHESLEPVRLAWVGDYMEDDDMEGDFKQARHIPENVNVFANKDIWDSDEPNGFHGEGILLDHKFIVNHEQKQYMDCDEYFKAVLQAEMKNPNLTAEDCWMVHPIPLLTAIGNDRGGGDYHSGYINSDNVGIWAWNLLSVEDEPPKGYEKILYIFSENLDSKGKLLRATIQDIDNIIKANNWEKKVRLTQKEKENLWEILEGCKKYKFEPVRQKQVEDLIMELFDVSAEEE